MPVRGTLLLLLCVLSVVGCRATAPTPPAPAEPDSPGRTQPAPDLRLIIERLEAGNLVEAEGLLEALLAERPNHTLARRYLEQLRGDPVALFGSDYHEIEVGVGDSLSAIAQRELGDAHLFLALARYNGIDVPRRLAAGQRLRIPKALGSSSAPLAAAELDLILIEPMVPDAPAPAPAQPASAQVSQRQAVQARALLGQAEAERAAGHDRLALAALDQAIELDPELLEAKDQARILRRELVAGGHEAALARFREQELAAAIEIWDEVLLLDPEFTPAQVYRARAEALLDRLQRIDE